jgi:hypothetical protein
MKLLEIRVELTSMVPFCWDEEEEEEKVVVSIEIGIFVRILV